MLRAPGHVDAGGDITDPALGADVDARVGHRVVVPVEVAAGDGQVLAIGLVAATDFQATVGGHLAAGLGPDLHLAGQRALQAEAAHLDLVTQADGQLHVQR
ncbi:hypothetical protein D3C72_984780 [compost metagenome]